MNTVNNIRFVNVLEYSLELYEYCKKNDFLGSNIKSYDDFIEAGGDLSFFEGDPDMIKIDGVTGYFAECGGVVFYWMEDYEGKAEPMLKAFFGAWETGVTLGGNSWRRGCNPEGVNESDEIQNWKAAA